MTLFDLMPSLWLVFAFIFFAVYFLSGMRLFLTGCGGALLALCPSLLGRGIFMQTVLFFSYMAFVYCACLIKRMLPGRSCFRGAAALTSIDCNGGYILYKGRVCRAYPHDRLFEYVTGDALAVAELSNGTLCAYRI